MAFSHWCYGEPSCYLDCCYFIGPSCTTLPLHVATDTTGKQWLVSSLLCGSMYSNHANKQSCCCCCPLSKLNHVP